MFQKICIKSKEKDTQKVDISFLLDSMLFYGKVIVLVHKEELITLLRYFGEDFLTELITSGRIELRVRENILGSMSFPGDKYGIGLFEGKGKSYSTILYEAHRETVRNSASNQKFSDHFSKITQPFQYTQDITEQIKADFENESLLKKLLPIYINARLPQFQLPDELSIEIIKDNSFGPFDAYTLNTNMDIIKLNELSKEMKGDDHHDFNYSGFLLALSESQGDIFIASHFESELVTSKLYSDFISQQLEDLIRRRSKSEENLHLFGEYILENCHSIGDAFMSGMISKKELLEILETADKFRDWLLKIPEDKNIIWEYHKAVSEKTIADKLPTKATRFVIFEGIGIALDVLGAGGIGTAVGLGLSAVDNFYLDKLIGGWKPNQFIEKDLIPAIKKQEQ
ncbi:hypothetical protein EZ456_20805 [Pedobacter psychrodurus]|uniref:Uncharacterized protein n=1 Tax=Pedobacter psychrodurus TaxID=2530456 RepID=A0A4R0PM56_9SPHI|nr:hypothetical protein [Pedobacter psychrodurus]TCD18939.1 hypothetical protein EZ456_20805 [Pedobacter psychrodurus]